MDATSKNIVSYVVGKRTADNAQALAHYNFDTVMCINVLEHTADDANATNGCNRCAYGFRVSMPVSGRYKRSQEVVPCLDMHAHWR